MFNKAQHNILRKFKKQTNSLTDLTKQMIKINKLLPTTPRKKKSKAVSHTCQM